MKRPILSPGGMPAPLVNSTPATVLSGAHGFASGRRSGLGRLTSTPGEPWAPGPFLAGDCPEILIHRSANPSQSEQVLVRFLRIVSGLAFTDEIAHRFGRENAQLLSVGQAISQFDLAIAATALHHDLVLLTENRRHYERIPGLKLQSIKTL